METIKSSIKKAQQLMGFGYWDAAHDVLDEVLKMVESSEKQMDDLKKTIQMLDQKSMRGLK